MWKVKSKEDKNLKEKKRQKRAYHVWKREDIKKKIKANVWIKQLWVRKEWSAWETWRMKEGASNWALNKKKRQISYRKLEDSKGKFIRKKKRAGERGGGGAKLFFAVV